MILKTLSLVHYKNFSSSTFHFDDKINCFVGNNGVGKTNVLDAIYHLSFGKSYFNPITGQNIQHDADFFVIEGNYYRFDKNEKVVVSAKRNQKKIIKKNGKDYEKFSDHVGFLPLVIISPADRDLIVEGSDVRRKFIDGVISQRDKDYLQNLIAYNKVLAQRNAYLKYAVANNIRNTDAIAVYNQQLNKYGMPIYQARKRFVTDFIPIFKEQHQAISGGNETVTLRYKSQLDNSDLHTLLEKHFEKDRALQYSSAGVHKDDLVFEIEEYPIKKFGSQGQQKSYLIALKLAQFNFLKQQNDLTPILLLDDIFDKLDESRVAQLIQLVNDEKFGQLFISDTHRERTESIVKNVHQSYKMFQL